MKTYKDYLSALILVCLICASELPAFSVTTSGEIVGEETWSGVVTITGDVIISASGTLRIAPGTVINVDPVFDDQASGVDVNEIEIRLDGGTLICEGEETNSIVFTIPPGNPQKGSWDGLRILSGDFVLKSTLVEFAEEGLVLEGGNSDVIFNCIFSNCSESGMRIRRSGITFDRCYFVGNDKYGIKTDANKLIFGLENCHLEGNTLSALHCQQNSAAYSDIQIRLQKTEIVQNGSNSSQGAVFFVARGELSLVDSKVNNNKTNGINMVYGNIKEIRNSEISNNRLNGITANSVNLWVRNSKVNDNGTHGLMIANGILSMTDCIVHNNLGNGVQGNHLLIDRCDIRGNVGNGVHQNSNTGRLSLTNSFLIANKGDGVLYETFMTKDNRGNWVSSQISGNSIQYYKNGIQAYAILYKGNQIQLTDPNDVYNNSDYDFRNFGTDAYVISNWYWGNATNAEIQSGRLNLANIFDRRDDVRFGSVIIRVNRETPNYTEPTPTPPIMGNPTPTSTPLVTPVINPTSTPTPSPTSAVQATPTPALPQRDVVLVKTYEFQESSLLDNGWSEISGGFNRTRTGGTVQCLPLSSEQCANSKDQRGLVIQVNPDELSLLFANEPIQTDGYPLLLRLSLHTSSPMASIALAALRGNLRTGAGVNSSIATHIPYSAETFMEDGKHLVLLYQPDQGSEVTPIIQVVSTSQIGDIQIGGVTVWIDRLSVYQVKTDLFQMDYNE